ncbi:MAG: TonB-dependent receptor [Flavobacteriaceae bacterium]
MNYWIIIFAFIPIVSFSQERLEGRIEDAAATQEPKGLGGANVYWLGTTIGTVTDFDGNFSIPYESNYQKLVISYVGYKTDTLTVTSNQRLVHQMKASSTLEEVTVAARKKASSRSTITAQNVINVSSAELLKAACCNLSESFETNPSIDVNFADAVTGTRQIKMLGLTSPYILITTENVPSVRGAAQNYGLSFIPGTWVESIQITKGAGSVTNGFESIAGQINAELQKPTSDEKLFVNAYGSMNGRLELNTHINTRVSPKWSTGVYLHGNLRNHKFDKNEDGFLDVPLANQINFLNRWQYTDAEKGWVSFLNIRYLNDSKQTGELDFDPETDKLTTQSWGSEIKTQRYDFSGKLGYVNPNIPYQSAGLQLAYSYHDQESYFGLRTYNITHHSLYANALYNSIISDSRHKIKTGMSFTYDGYDELANATLYNRKENSVGAFFEYAFDNLDALSLTAGVRVDNHNILGFFVTPRLHVKYTPWEKSALRFSMGRGKRSANIFAENMSLFATSRQITIENQGGKLYGLDPEIAWNYGVSFLQGFDLFKRKATVTVDFYRTDFTHQVVVDWETPTQINFYNLDGDSFSNSFQIEWDYNPLNRLDFRFAYKYYDVQTQYRNGKLEKPLTPKNRIFANASFETERKENDAQWKFDATYNWLGSQRFPSTVSSPLEFQLPEYTPTVGTLNTQVTKVFNPHFEVYLGGENITNVKQPQPIVSAENPFGPNFDTTFVYGPIFGSMYYAGLRYKL